MTTKHRQFFWLSLFPLLLGALFAARSHAATLAITSDQASYDVGDTITITISGDSEGATSWGVFSNLLWNSTLVDTLAVTQGSLGPDWFPGATLYGEGYAYVWNQIAYPEPMSGAGTSTVSLLATHAGTLGFSWAMGQDGFDFFGVPAFAGVPILSVGITGAPIVDPIPLGDPGPAVPEPSAALIFALGLLAVRCGRRFLF